MNKSFFLAAAISLPFLSYACSTDDDGDSSELGGAAGQIGGVGAQAGSKASTGGAPGSGSSRGGAFGTASVGGSGPRGGSAGVAGISIAGAPIAGAAGRTTAGASNASGTAGSAMAGAFHAGGSGNLAGRPNAGQAGTLPSAGTAGIRVAAAGAAGRWSGGAAGALQTANGGGAGVGGLTAIAGNSGVAGTAGAAGVTCGALCTATSCATAPQCLEDSYGYGSGDAIGLCVPSTSLGGVATVCATTTCNGGAGCPLTATLGATTWTLAAGASAGVTDVLLDTIVTNLTGPIGVTGLVTCTLTADIPTGGIAVRAIGTAEPALPNSQLVGVSFDRVEAPLTGLTVSSSVSSCNSLSSFITQAGSAIRGAILEALNARAAALLCDDCRGDCPERLACVAPAP